MSTQVVQCSEAHGLMTITINRPEKLNALNQEVLDGLQQAINDLNNNSKLHGAIITGSGEKAFVAGADIGSFLKHDRSKGHELSEYGQNIFAAIENSGKPVIAAVNGFALGGGCELAMSCHFRIASENAKFGQPEINLGIIPGYGGTQRLPRLIGKGRAMEMMMTGEMIDVQEALKLGLVNQVCTPSTLMTTATEKMLLILSKPSYALEQIIRSVNSSEGNPKEGYTTEASCFGKSFASEEMTEGVSAFVEKRKPNFKKP